MSRKINSKYIYVLAVACSTVTLGVIMVILLRWQIPRSQGLLLPLAGCFLLGSVFSFFRNVNPWMLGLWASSAIWVYFSGVFLSLTLHRETEWLPLFEAAAAMGFGIFGVLVTQRLTRVVWRSAT